MTVEHGDLPVATLLRDADREKLVLPNFQREYVWTVDAQKRLVASLLADVPVGAVLLLQGEPGDYASRRIALVEDAKPKPECVYLLDGQQRLSTLAVALSSPFNQDRPWRDVFNVLPAKLRYVWRLRIQPLSEEEDIFGYYDLSFPDHLDLEPEQLTNFLSPLRVLVKEEDSGSAWYHPNWQRNVPEKERMVLIANAAAKEGIVPLWALAQEDQTHLLDITLQVIAGMRRVFLESGADFDTNPELYDKLRRADPTLPADWRDAPPNQVTLAFGSLAERWRTAMLQFVRAMLARRVPTIELQREDISRAVAIFEVINQGGTPLTPFDLIVAKNAKDPQASSLLQMLVQYLQQEEVKVGQAAWFEPGTTPSIAKWETESRDICVSNGSLTTVFKNSFLNLLSLRFHTTNGDVDSLDVKHIKRAAILAVPAPEISAAWKEVATSLLKAWAFLQLRCGIYREADLRYKLMALPLAYSIMRMPDRWGDPTFHNRLEYWYWTSLFGGVFRERQNENAVNELKNLFKWLDNDDSARALITSRQSKVLDVPGYSDKGSLLVRDQDSTISSDVSYAILQYVLSLGPKDFRISDPQRLYAWQDIELEDHHIIPLATATTLRESASELRARGDDHILNSPLNRTFISRQANRDIGPKSPTQYWADLKVSQPASHLLPGSISTISALGGEGWEDKVRQLLDDRFQRIRERLFQELDSLSE